MSETASTPAKRVYCNSCRRLTNHVCRCEYSEHNPLDDEGGFETHTYRLLSCAGCETPTLETEWGAFGSGFDDVEPSFSYQPQRADSSHPPKIFRRIPPKLRTIYRESVLAYNHGLLVLCAAGLRALIEGICADKGIAGRNLEKKIDAMEEILPKGIVDNLHGFRFMGNTAVHELTAPKRADLKIAIEVSEDLLNFLYDLNYKASQLPKSTSTPGAG